MQPKEAPDLETKDDLEVFAVHQVLGLGNHDGAGLLVQTLVIPFRVDLGQLAGHPVVLPQEQGVGGGQPGKNAGPIVAFGE